MVDVILVPLPLELLDLALMISTVEKVSVFLMESVYALVMLTSELVEHVLVLLILLTVTEMDVVTSVPMMLTVLPMMVLHQADLTPNAVLMVSVLILTVFTTTTALQADLTADKMVTALIAETLLDLPVELVLLP